ncbi:MAG: hypothetical protein WDO71_00510 [Bacteroidota bacterium]
MMRSVATINKPPTFSRLSRPEATIITNTIAIPNIGKIRHRFIEPI